jgi:hypothetical protein
MKFLYGDSSPSPLATDFIDFLRKALDCSVAILQAEQRMLQGAARRQELERRAEQDLGRIRDLESTVSRAIVSVVEKDSPDAPVTHCSDVMSRAVSAAAAEQQSFVKSVLGEEVQRIDESAAKERGRCVKAIEELLLTHDLPGHEGELIFEQKATGGSSARLRSTTSYGVAAMLDLDLPAGSLFARRLFVGAVVDSLDIEVPKRTRMTTEKLQRFLITRCSFGPRVQRVSLRTETVDEGYDFICATEGPRFTARRVAAGADAPEELELETDDMQAVLAFVEKLVAASATLPERRKAMAAVAIDGEPLENHRQPSVLVKRLIEAMAPIVREISARSRPKDELVIRRQLDDGRREERFVRRAELLAKLERLPAGLRALFAPLALGDVPGTPPPVEDSGETVTGSAIIEENTASGSRGGASPSGAAT